MMKMALSTKSIYEPITRADGYRVLIMRLWPRGIKKSKVAVWSKELAPDYALLRAFKSNGMSWSEFSRRYRAGLKKAVAQEQLKNLKGILKKRKVTLLCACRDESRC